MIRWLRALFGIVPPDEGLDLHAHQFGTKPAIGGTYDYAKAKAASERARRQTATGRSIPKPKAIKRGRIVPFRKEASR